MPKMKTHQGIAKRIKVTGRGKLMRRKAFANHLLGKKQASAKRNYAVDHEVSTADERNIKDMLGM